MRSRRAALAIVAGAVAGLGCWPQHGAPSGETRVLAPTEAGFPKRPLTIIAPANPGGGWDQIARLLQHVLTREGMVGVPVEVVNRGGAGGTIGLAQLATRHRGDPHTMMIAGGVMVGAIVTHGSPFGLEDTVPLARMVDDYEVIAVPASSPYRDLGALMAAFRERPREIAWGGGSAGGTDHMTVGLLALSAGVDPAAINYVAFTGGGEAAAAVMGGQITAGMSGYSEWKGLADGGLVRLLGVSAPHAIGGVPSFREAGYDVVLANWRGVVAPPGIDPEARAWLTEALRRVHEAPAWEDIVQRNRWQDSFLPGEAYRAFLVEEKVRTTHTLASLGLGPGGSGYAALGPWAFPAAVGLGLLVSGVAAIRIRRPVESAGLRSEPAAALRAWLPTAALLLAYITLLEPMGFLLATTAYMFLQARVLGSRMWRRDLVSSIALAALAYLVFKRLLQIALPAGILG